MVLESEFFKKLSRRGFFSSEAEEFDLAKSYFLFNVESAVSIFTRDYSKTEFIEIINHYIVLIHLYSASLSMRLSEALATTALILCRSYHAEALQTTASEGLA